MASAGPQKVTHRVFEMFRPEDMNEILSCFRSADVRPRDDSLPVWDVGRPGLFARQRRHRRQTVAECRRQLLSAVLGGDGPIFLTHEPPRDYEVPGDWQPAGEATWLVPRDFDPDHPAAAYWLFVIGNWNLYRAPAPPEGRWPDAFRCGAAELLEWMRAKSVQALIESFHDDTDWTVALAADGQTAAPGRGRPTASS
jgi:hypothetical protein